MNDDFQKTLDDHEQRILQLEALFKKNPETSVKKELSPKEFMLMIEPKGEPQKTLCVAFYLEKYRSVMPLNVKDLELGFREAKETVPANINYLAISNIRQGYLMEAKGKKDGFKSWSLTASGEKFIESLMGSKENAN